VASIVITAWFAIEIAKYLIAQAAVQEVAIRLGVKVLTRVALDTLDPSFLFFLHGSSTGAWAGGDFAGIDWKAGGDRQDFGLGFYTFKFPEGVAKAIERANKKERTAGGYGFVLVTQMSPMDYASLSKLDYTQPPLANQYVLDVNNYRRTGGWTGWDLVLGPVAVPDPTGWWIPNPTFAGINQYKFETGVAKLKPIFIFPV
jgi:hypothetical protein